MKFPRLFPFALVAVVASSRAADAPAKPLYHNDFEAAEVGKLPAEMMVMAGDFAVRQEAKEGMIKSAQC